jgi:hypothetical protein
MQKSLWEVGLSTKAKRQISELEKKNPKVYALFALLAKELEVSGPWRKNWPHYSPLKGKNLPENTFHCHIKSGKPTYVVCWCIEDKEVKIIEVFYVGTHEKAPY